MQQTAPQPQKKVLLAPVAPVFPAGTATAQLLSSIGRIEKQEEARKPILSKDARIVYLATKEEGMTAIWALEEANRLGLTLVPFRDIYERLNGKDQIWKAEEQFYPVWTGTFIAFEAPGVTLKETTEYTDSKTGITYVFNVPRNAQGKRNIALAINHGFREDGKPLISFKKTGEKEFLAEIADEIRIKIIKKFPTREGWHLPEKEFGIPAGARADKYSNNARCLRSPAFVGLLSLGPGHEFYAGLRPSIRFGVLAYAKQQPQTEEIQK